MPNCNIIQCGARKYKKRPQLTLHRYPKNELLQQRWTDAIGIHNLNTQRNIKNWYICSDHFDESCFNRTLDVMRLHDDSIPTIFLHTSALPHHNKQETCTPQKIQQTDTSHEDPLDLIDVKVEPSEEDVDKPEINLNKRIKLMECIKANQDLRIKKLTAKCALQQKKVRQINEKIRTRNVKIANLKNMIIYMKRKNSSTV